MMVVIVMMFLTTAAATVVIMVTATTVMIFTTAMTVMTFLIWTLEIFHYTGIFEVGLDFLNIILIPILQEAHDSQGIYLFLIILNER